MAETLVIELVNAFTNQSQMKTPLRVLLVGTFENERQVEKMLLTYGIPCEVQVATSGEEALNYCGDFQPAIVLIDVIMNGMTGLETARWIKEQSKHVKIVLVSEGMCNRLLLEHEITSFCDGHIKKNSPVEIYINLIRKLAGR